MSGFHFEICKRAWCLSWRVLSTYEVQTCCLSGLATVGITTTNDEVIYSNVLWMVMYLKYVRNWTNRRAPIALWLWNQEIIGLRGPKTIDLFTQNNWSYLSWIVLIKFPSLPSLWSLKMTVSSLLPWLAYSVIETLRADTKKHGHNNTLMVKPLIFSASNAVGAESP